MERKILYITIVLIFSLVFFQRFSAWAVPGLIHYQGKFTDSGSNLLNGDYDITFSCYTVANGGTPLWSEIQQSVKITDGFLNVHLGAKEAFPEGLFNNDELYLEITIKENITGLEETLSPRQRFTSVPYSMKGLDADTVDGKHADEFLDTSNKVLTKSGGLNITGNVGIGTTEPTAKLDVNGDISQPIGGWKKIGQDRYTFSQKWFGGLPTPSNNYTYIDIGSPFESTRDYLWTGTITVAARTGGNIWDIQYFYYGNFWGHTIYGNDWVLSPITGSGLRIVRPNDRSNTMGIIIPGNDYIVKLHIHIDMYASYII